MDESGAAPERVVGGRPAVSLKHQRGLAVAVVLYSAFVVWQLSRGRWTGIPAYVLWAAWLGVILLRRPTVVDAGGIRRPWRLRGTVAWSDVDRVAAPQAGITRVRLWMKNGKTVTLDDVTVEHSAAVAAIGGTPLGSPPQHAAPPPPRPATGRDIEVDVHRRAEALAERGKQLDAEYRRIQRRSPAPDPRSPDEPL